MAAGDVHKVFLVGGQIHHDYFELARRLDRAIAFVSGRIHVNAGARIVRWRDLLDRLCAADPRGVVEELVPPLRSGNWNHPYAAEFRALVEARQFVVIVEALWQVLAESELQALVSGALHAASDGENAPGRDRQFELFLAAVASRAGMRLALQEPDVLVEVNGGTLGLAAKRVRSKLRVEKNLSKAARQVVGATVRGIVFLDVSRLLDRGAQAITHWSSAEKDLGGALLAFEREHAHSFRKRRDALVEGVVLYVSVPLLGKRFRLGTAELWWPVGNIDASVPAAVMTFLNRFADGACHPDVVLSV